MKNTIVATLVTFFITLGPARCQEPETLDELIGRIAAVPDGESGLSESERTYIEKLLAHGNAAVPPLVELLSNPDENISELAAAALGDCPRIDPKYLPRIIAGLDRDIGWLPRALGRMESDLAAQEAVKRYLGASSSPHNQEAYAVKLQGARAIPFIIEAAVKNKGEDPHVDDLLGHVLGEMEDAERKQAASELLVFIKDKNTSVGLLRGILGFISHLEKPARFLENDLVELKKSRPDLRDEVDRALIGIRSAHLGPIFVEILRRNPGVATLRDIAEVGEAAEGAGGEIAKLLDHADWQLRLGAARTLGFIGSHDGDERLIELLNESSDVRLNLVAAESLGRLRSKPALQALGSTAKVHWHPAVRDAARIAAEKIESNASYEFKYHRDNFPSEYYDYQNMGLKLPEDPAIPMMVEPSSLGAHAERDPGLIGKLSYPADIAGYKASGQEAPKSEKGKDAVTDMNEDDMAGGSRKPARSPEVGIRVPGGWLLGADRGEWGGELVFKGDDRKPYCILRENINGLFKLGERFIAVTGLAHLSLNDGLIYEMKFTDGEWRAEPWRALPGAPETCGKLKSGDVMVATYGGGMVVLSEDGSFRMADITSPSGRETK